MEGARGLRLLLDTHIWLWSLLEPARLTERVRTQLRSSKNELWLSPISVWETLMLIEHGRVATKGEPRQVVERWLTAGPFHQASLTHAVALESRRPTIGSGDPADRFLAATAIVYELTLITADRRLLETRDYPTLANR